MDSSLCVLTINGAVCDETDERAQMAVIACVRVCVCGT